MWSWVDLVVQGCRRRRGAEVQATLANSVLASHSGGVHWEAGHFGPEDGEDPRNIGQVGPLALVPSGWNARAWKRQKIPSKEADVEAAVGDRRVTRGHPTGESDRSREAI